MRVSRLVWLLTGVAAVASCHKQPPPQDQNIAVTNATAENDIETLPADESDTTPSNQLLNGADNPDVNAPTNNSTE